MNRKRFPGAAITLVGVLLLAAGLFGAGNVPVAEAVGDITVDGDLVDTAPSASGTWSNGQGGPCENNSGVRWTIGINWNSGNDGDLAPTHPDAQEELFGVDCSTGDDPGPRDWEGPGTFDGAVFQPCVTLYHAPVNNVQGQDVGGDATTCDQLPPPPEQGTLTVEKVCNPEDSEELFSVDIDIDGFEPVDIPCGGSTGAIPADPGDYNVTEQLADPGAWSVTFGGDCDSEGGVTVVVGESATCTITNNQQPGHLSLYKEVEGGTAEPVDWTLFADGPEDADFQGTDGDGFDVPQGSYLLSESDDGPPNYTASAWRCFILVQQGETTQFDEVEVSEAVVIVPAGANVECTITNTFEPPPDEEEEPNLVLICEDGDFILVEAGPGVDLDDGSCDGPPIFGGQDPDPRNFPTLGGVVQVLGVQATPTPVAQVLGVVVPPATGDGGLSRDGDGAGFALAAGLAGLAGVALLAARRRSNQA